MLTIFRIAFLFLVVQISLGNWIVQSQPSPQAPIKQESKDPIEGKSETNKPANSSAKASLDNTIGPPSNLEKQPSREAKGGPDEGTEFAVLFGVKFKITDGLLALFTLLLVIVTGALAAIAIWQGCQLKASVSLAREEFNATHRPRIVVRRISPIEEGSVSFPKM